GRIPRGNRLAIVTNGRGPGLLAADCAADNGVQLAAFSDPARAALAALLPANVKPSNPVDVCGEGSPERVGAAVRAVLDDPMTDAGLALPVAVRAAPPTDTARAVAEGAKGAAKPVLAAWLGAVDRPEVRAALEAAGIPDFFTPENAVEAFSFLTAYRRNQEWLLEVPPPQPELAAPDFKAPTRVREQAIAAGHSLLDDGETRKLLAAFGIAVAPARTRLRSASAQDARIAVYGDAVFGPVIAFGAAGARVGEMSLMLPPLSRRLAHDL